MAVTIRYGRQLRVVRSPDFTGSPEEVAEPTVYFVGRGGSTSDSSVDLQLSRDERTMSRRVAAIDCPFDGYWRIRRVSANNGVLLLTGNGGRMPVETDWLPVPEAWGPIHVRVVTPRAEFDFAVLPGTIGNLGNSEAIPSLLDNLPTQTARGIQYDSAPKHFLTCIALCKPTLLDPHEDRVPSAQEMLDTLVAAGVEPADRKSTRIQRRLEEVAGWLLVEPRTNRSLRDRLIASRAVTHDHLLFLNPPTDGTPWNHGDD